MFLVYKKMFLQLNFMQEVSLTLKIQVNLLLHRFLESLCFLVSVSLTLPHVLFCSQSQTQEESSSSCFPLFLRFIIINDKEDLILC